jgi:hypothetical protein
MSVDTAVAYEAPAVAQARERRTLLLGTRLALAALAMLQFAMLFAYLYLRGNNFNGAWHPDGIAQLEGVPVAIILAVQLACLAAVAVALRAGSAAAARGIAAVALLLAVGAMVGRVLLQYHLGDGWVIENGTYPAVSEMWFGILIVQVGLGCLWLLSIVMGARDRAATSNHLRAFADYWLFSLVLSALVFMLVRLVV